MVVANQNRPEKTIVRKIERVTISLKREKWRRVRTRSGKGRQSRRAGRAPRQLGDPRTGAEAAMKWRRSAGKVK